MIKKEKNKNQLLIMYDEQEMLIRGIKSLQDKGIGIANVFSPYPVEQLNTLVPAKTVPIASIGFWSGVAGGILGFLFQAWVAVESYPLLYGGKPYFTPLTFFPATFEFAVLFAGIAISLAFFTSQGLYPGSRRMPVQKQVTNDKFAFTIIMDKLPREESIAYFINILADSRPVSITVLNSQ